MIKDFCLEGDSTTIKDEYASLIQQIDLLFDTKENEVFGEEYGSNFEQFLWDMRASASEISDYTESIIFGSVQLMGWDLKVNTDLMQGTINDIILITIKLSKYNTSFEKIYKIE